jgi:hypothetical protein
MIVFRGTRTVSPDKINIKHSTNGYYGKGTYYALDEETAFRYSSNAIEPITWNLISIVECSFFNPLIISNQDISNLSHFLPEHSLKLSEVLQNKLNTNELMGSHLCSVAAQAGYDAILTKGKVEGGEQLILPEGSSATIAPVSYILFLPLRNSSISESFIEHFNGLGFNAKRIPQHIRLEFSSDQIELAMTTVNFFNKANSLDVLSVDFDKNTVEYYEED